MARKWQHGRNGCRTDDSILTSVSWNQSEEYLAFVGDVAATLEGPADARDN